MGWQYTLFVLGIFTSLFFTLGLSTYALNNRALKGTKIFIWLMLAIAEILFCDLIRWLSDDQQIQIISAKLSYLGSAVVPTAIFLFAMNFTGRQQWLTRKHLILLSAVPVATLLLAWSNEFHHLVWLSIRYYKEGSLLFSDTSYGVWFWIFQAYGNLLVICSLVLLITETIRRPRLPRWVVVILLLSLLMPWSGTILYTLRLGPIPNLDLSRITYTFSILVILWAILCYNVFGIASTARTKLIDNMKDSMIVLTTSSQIIDINPSAQLFFNLPSTQILGKSIEQLLPDWQHMLAKAQESGETEVELTVTQPSHNN